METLYENAGVISASKVTGTNVYNTDGEHLGEIYDIMLDKRSGKIAYAVMSFGGFLGIGERYHTLPWSTLKYDTRQGGYVVAPIPDRVPLAPRECNRTMPLDRQAADRTVFCSLSAFPMDRLKVSCLQRGRHGGGIGRSPGLPAPSCAPTLSFVILRP